MKQTFRTIFALLFALLAQTICAQGYPVRPVTIVVPYSAGGPVDNFVRSLGLQLADRWHQPVKASGVTLD